MAGLFRAETGAIAQLPASKRSFMRCRMDAVLDAVEEQRVERLANQEHRPRHPRQRIGRLLRHLGNLDIAWADDDDAVGAQVAGRRNRHVLPAAHHRDEFSIDAHRGKQKRNRCRGQAVWMLGTRRATTLGISATTGQPRLAARYEDDRVAVAM